MASAVGRETIANNRYSTHRFDSNTKQYKTIESLESIAQQENICVELLYTKLHSASLRSKI